MCWPGSKEFSSRAALLNKMYMAFVVTVNFKNHCVSCKSLDVVAKPGKYNSQGLPPSTMVSAIHGAVFVMSYVLAAFFCANDTLHTVAEYHAFVDDLPAKWYASPDALNEMEGAQHYFTMLTRHDRRQHGNPFVRAAFDLDAADTFTRYAGVTDWIAFWSPAQEQLRADLPPLFLAGLRKVSPFWRPQFRIQSNASLPSEQMSVPNNRVSKPYF
jgi:hypothetical protein